MCHADRLAALMGLSGVSFVDRMSGAGFRSIVMEEMTGSFRAIRVATANAKIVRWRVLDDKSVAL